MNKWNLYGLTAFFLLSSFDLFANPAAQQHRVSVVTARVELQQLSQTLNLVGKLASEQAVDVSTEVAGKIAEINVATNQRVQSGQVLVRLTNNKVQASLLEAKAYWQDERRKLREFSQLVKKHAVTQTELEAQGALVDIAKARFDLAKAALNERTIRSPFAGTVGLIHLSRGQYLTVGSVLFTLDDLSKMELDLAVPERYLSYLSLDTKVVGTSDAWPQLSFIGAVKAIDSRVDAQSLTITTRVQFDNSERSLKPGMLMSAQIPLQPIEAATIPVQALEYAGSKRFVYLVGGDQTAIRTEVELGARMGNKVVIKKGVHVGQRVVVQGLINMRDGVKVQEVTKIGTAIKSEG